MRKAEIDEECQVYQAVLEALELSHESGMPVPMVVGNDPERTAKFRKIIEEALKDEYKAG